MSVNEVFVLKGIAILLIILHNFSHRLPGTVQENQHFFLAERFDQMVSVLTNGGPNLLINLLSHYGHYGVAIFVFLCGYGLAIKYTRETTDISFAAFSLKHAKKLWLLMLPLLLPHFLFMCIKKASYFSDHIGDLLMMTTFTSGFNPDPYVLRAMVVFLAYFPIIYRLLPFRIWKKPETGHCNYDSEHYTASRNNGIRHNGRHCLPEPHIRWIHVTIHGWYCVCPEKHVSVLRPCTGNAGSVLCVRLKQIPVAVHFYASAYSLNAAGKIGTPFGKSVLVHTLYRRKFGIHIYHTPHCKVVHIGPERNKRIAGLRSLPDSKHCSSVLLQKTSVLGKAENHPSPC